MNQIVPVEQKTVNFDGDELLGVKASNGRVYAGVKGMCLGVGLNEEQAKYQAKKIMDDPVLRKGGEKITLLTPGGPQEVLCLSIDYLPLWLAKINAGIIDDPLVQQKVINYQLRAKDVLAEAFFPKPKSIEDLIIVQAQLLKDVRLQTEAAREQAAVASQLAERAHHRIDSLDNVGIEGNLRQRFERMIRKYAFDRGIAFSVAWHHFDAAYNVAFHANLTAQRNNYCAKHGLHDVSRPDYFDRIGRLEDAIRVADKMLNQ